MTDMDQQLAALEGLTTTELAQRYAELYGQECRSRHRLYLLRKVAWRIQAMAEGDLTERARRRAEELANDADIRVMPPKPKNVAGLATRRLRAPHKRDPRLPAPGTAIVRKYHGGTIRVIVTDDGFEWDGRRFPTLTAVANAVTGTHINGFRFFALGGPT